MVLREAADGLYLVTQLDHARLAGELARRWNCTRLPAVADREFLEAVGGHDSGWEPLDRQPTFGDNGRPVSFLEWPLTSAVDAWRRSIEAARSLGPRAAEVVTRHFCLLGRMALPRELPADQRQALEGFLAEHQSPAFDAALDNWLRLLQLCDLLSLHLITGGKMNTTLLRRYGIDVRFEAERDCLHLDPLPFTEAVHLECPARFLAADSRIPIACDPLRFTVTR